MFRAASVIETCTARNNAGSCYTDISRCTDNRTLNLMVALCGWNMLLCIWN